MKLEVGQFVRFKDKRGIEYIRKIVEIPEDNRYASLYLDKEANYSHGLSPKNVIKGRFNIIDLIKIGDYVNGSKVIKIESVENYPDLSSVKIEKSDFRYGVYETVFEKDIKSVITHEQMEQMAYKVGE